MPKTTKPAALKTKPKYYIGIDTGVNTGVAVWNTQTRAFEFIETVKIHRALETAYHFVDTHGIDNIFIIVEDARKRKYDPGLTDEKKQGAGSIKRDATIWEDFLTDLGANFRMVAPNGKLNKLAENVKLWEANCKWTKRTSKHARDAAMLVLNA